MGYKFFFEFVRFKHCEYFEVYKWVGADMHTVMPYNSPDDSGPERPDRWDLVEKDKDWRSFCSDDELCAVKQTLTMAGIDYCERWHD